MIAEEIILISTTRLAVLIGFVSVVTLISLFANRSRRAVRAPWIAAVILGTASGPVLMAWSAANHQRLHHPQQQLFDEVDRVQLEAEQQVEYLRETGVSPVATREELRRLQREVVRPARRDAEQADRLINILTDGTPTVIAGLCLFLVGFGTLARRLHSPLSTSCAIAILIVWFAALTILSRAPGPTQLVSGAGTLVLGWLAGILNRVSARTRSKLCVIVSTWAAPTLVVLQASQVTPGPSLLISVALTLALSFKTLCEHRKGGTLGLRATLIACCSLLIGDSDTLPLFFTDAVGGVILGLAIGHTCRRTPTRP